VRIAHVTATFPPYLGGAGTVAFHQADGLARRDHDVEVFTARSEGSPPASAATVHRLDPLWRTGNAPILPRLATLRGFDVVHLHHPFIFGTELLLASRVHARPPLVVTYHNQLIGEGRRRALFAGWEATWGRALLRAASRILVVSDAHAATVPGLRRVAGKLTEVPNGVDLDAFRPDDGRAGDAGGTRERLGVPEDAVVVAFVSTLDRAHYLKRPDLALAALAASRDPRVHLLVIGGGEWLERLRGQAPAGRVTFAGSRGHDELPALLRASDVLLSTSDRESFGIVLIEGMACGLPVVSTDPPGVRAVVEHEVCGLLAPTGDAAALGAALGRLAADPDERRAFGAAGRARCEQRYGWPRIVDRLESVYAALP
jgi:glycosyltransferase involved in cell wall biosynthesis